MPSKNTPCVRAEKATGPAALLPISPCWSASRPSFSGSSVLVRSGPKCARRCKARRRSRNFRRPPVKAFISRRPVGYLSRMAQTDLELLIDCADFTLHHTSEAEQAVLKALETSAATRLVMLTRMFNLQRAILAIGMFSLFEALLQSALGWEDPFQQLDAYLRWHNKPELATTINDYKLAINVLKHGDGRSHADLHARASSLQFKVRDHTETFFGEGDISAVSILVHVDDKFVRRCA